MNTHELDRAALLDGLTIREGTVADYLAMSHWHYRGRRPASIVRVLVASVNVREVDRVPLGVLVVAMPVLNGRWRELAWPGRYSTRDRRENALRLNREVRTISRVIVEPRARGVGIARRLVRAYLDEPLTVATEAIGAMATYSSFLSAAGMKAYPMPLTEARKHFAGCLEAIGVTPERVLADDAMRRRLARRESVRREVVRVLSESGRRWVDPDLDHFGRLAEACVRVCTRMTAYVSGGSDEVTKSESQGVSK